MLNDKSMCGIDYSLDTLSRLKGIETHQTLFSNNHSRQPLDTLSRLKGIETFQVSSRRCFQFGLLLWIRFPRLKGIETNIISFFKIIVCSLDTLSRLKGIETSTLTYFADEKSSLDTLSRLKGIETWLLCHRFEHL